MDELYGFAWIPVIFLGLILAVVVLIIAILLTINGAKRKKHIKIKTGHNLLLTISAGTLLYLTSYIIKVPEIQLYRWSIPYVSILTFLLLEISGLMKK